MVERDRIYREANKESMGFGEMTFQSWELRQLGYVVIKKQNRTDGRCFGQMGMAGRGGLKPFGGIVWHDEVRLFL